MAKELWVTLSTMIGSDIRRCLTHEWTQNQLQLLTNTLCTFYHLSLQPLLFNCCARCNKACQSGVAQVGGNIYLGFSFWKLKKKKKKSYLIPDLIQQHNFCLSINSQEIMTTRYEMSKLEWSKIFPALCWYGGRTRQLTAAGFTPGFAFRWRRRRCAIELSRRASHRVAWRSSPQCGGRERHPLMTPSVQRTLPEEKLSVHNFPWYCCYFEPFFPKRMFHFNEVL